MPPKHLYISKRVFGPPMSPSIFQDKWLSIFRDLYYEALNGETKSTRFVPLEAASHLSRQFEHLDRFDLESQALRLQKTDFPTVSEANIEAASNGQDEYDRKNGPGYMTNNPFAIAAQFKLWLDWYLERFLKMKLGAELDGVRWRNLPIDVRGRINDILEIRAKQVEHGCVGFGRCGLLKRLEKLFSRKARMVIEKRERISSRLHGDRGVIFDKAWSRYFAGSVIVKGAVDARVSTKSCRRFNQTNLTFSRGRHMLPIGSQY